MTRIPNFFIVGAPKCGTTALASYLRTHPNVFLSTPKEPNWFCDDFSARRQVDTLDAYNALFTGATPTQAAIGEASTIYLYSMNAISNIRRYNPYSRIIVMLRNPVDMVYSWHSQLVFNLEEDEKNFETAWRRQAKRGHRPMLQYSAIGKLGAQVERLVTIFPRQQVHFILFDDFKSDPARSYRATLEFLGLPQDDRTVFPRVNESKENRFPLVTQFLKRTPKVLTAGAKILKRALHVDNLGIADRVLRMTIRKRELLPLSKEFRNELTEHFTSDIRLLGDLIDRDLAPWLRCRL